MTWSMLALRSLVRLQRNEHASLVQRGGRPPGADAGTERGDSRVFRHDVEQGLHAVGHRRVGDVLRPFGEADDQSGILLRKEPLGDDDIEIAGETDGSEHDHQGEEPVPQGDLETALIGSDQAVETALDRPVEPSVAACRLSLLSRREHSIGVSVSEISSERTSATLTATANSWNSLPT